MRFKGYPQHVEHLQRRVEAVLADHQFDARVLCSGAPASNNRFDDQTWPLSPTPAFSHWCPLAEPNAYLAIRPGRKPTLVRTTVDDFWEAVSPPDSDHFWSEFDLVTAAAEEVGDALPTGHVAVVTRDPGAAPPGEVNPSALIAALDALRTEKTAYEIECLAMATARAVAGHRAAEARLLAGPASELEIHLAYLAASQQDDPATPYKNIVALGPHGAVLHYAAYDRTRVSGDTSLLVDAGARCNGYGSDITRTYVRGNGEAVRHFADLVTRIDQLQRELCANVRPGRNYEDLHDESHRLLAAALRELGIASGSTDELVDRGITRALFPHGLGHSLGIVTHDVGMKPRAPRPENRFLRNTSTIAVGQVFTIEPGVYFIAALLNPLRTSDCASLLNWRAIDELTRFGGVRVEDNIVVQDDGIRNLTREAWQRAAGDDLIP